METAGLDRFAEFQCMTRALDIGGELSGLVFIGDVVDCGQMEDVVDLAFDPRDVGGCDAKPLF